MELVELLVAIMKQHERILDVQLCACSLLLRSLGRGGCGARGVKAGPGPVATNTGCGGPLTHRPCGLAGARPSPSPTLQPALAGPAPERG